jgi:hypothetical protein
MFDMQKVENIFRFIESEEHFDTNKIKNVLDNNIE